MSSRRQFVTQSALLAFCSTLAHRTALATPDSAPGWSNWSGGQSCSNQALLYPQTEAELVSILKSTQGTVRAVGGGHSFSPLVPTRGTLISLEAMNGLISHDPKRLQATFHAGSRIAQVSSELSNIDQGLFNEADINVQSLAGALSTATHGTGRQLQCLSAYITAMKLITAEGDVLHCSRSEHAEVFQAARVSLGALGIVTEVTLQNRRSYALKEQVRVMPISEAMHYVDQNKDRFSHIEFMAFPFGDRAMVKTLAETQAPETPVTTPWIDENTLLEFAANTARKHPWSNSGLQHLLGMFVSDSTRVGPSWKIYPSTRAIRFNEMEYQLPAAVGMQACEEVMAAMRQHRLDVFFPLEFRYVAADDAWLSPFHDRDSVSISVHQYYRQDYHPIFAVIEPILRRHGGRPHWGKLNTLTGKDFQEIYPHWADFKRIQRQIDPHSRMLNRYLRQTFA